MSITIFSSINLLSIAKCISKFWTRVALDEKGDVQLPMNYSLKFTSFYSLIHLRIMLYILCIRFILYHDKFIKKFCLYILNHQKQLIYDHISLIQQINSIIQNVHIQKLV